MHVRMYAWYVYMCLCMYHLQNYFCLELIFESRSMKEKQSLQSFIKNIRGKFHNLRDLHDWLFTQHNAYALSLRMNAKNNKPINPELLKSY